MLGPWKLPRLVCALLILGGRPHGAGVGEPGGPYARQMAEQMARLQSPDAPTRAGAAEALGFLRAYDAENQLIDRLGDGSPAVRRQVALALAWCGSRRAMIPLLDAMDDADHIVRASAHVALLNLSGMELAFDATAPAPQRAAHVKVWRDWWRTVPADRPPADVLRLLEHWKNRPRAGSVTASSTFYEIEVNNPAEAGNVSRNDITWQGERALRALGSLGGEGATEAILDCLRPSPPSGEAYRPMMRAGIRALGRTRHPAGFSFLVGMLENTFWARYAADALGDFGDHRAVPALVAAYSKCAKQLDGSDPPGVPPDDKMSFPSEDRMLETPYYLALALSRLVQNTPADQAALREIAPRIMANLPGDHDTFILYEPEVAHRLTQYLLEHAGLRQAACEHAFALLGQAQQTPLHAQSPDWPRFAPDRMATWLPALCTQPSDLPRLIALLQHPEGWVRLNAAKTVAWLGHKEAVAPIAKILAEAQNEAAYGYSGTFKDEEYADPAPRWREGLIRALGLLGAHEHTDLIVRILEDEGSVLDVRHAAVRALADLGNNRARLALEHAARTHPFHSIRLVAQDALQPSENAVAHPAGAGQEEHAPWPVSADKPEPAELGAILFIKGDNNIPNTIGTVEQADRWRQTYVVTDSGPAYRPGWNLYILEPARPDGILRPLTRFTEGYVAEPEVSWDGKQILFTRRGRDDPWWHVYRINADGSGLEQLTDGPYHDVGPAFLPDSRIVFASSRGGIRDEYHGYPCTSLHVMAPDGTGIRPIATNIGRDNEPAILLDGRIVFSRLEVFYSRNKTELTLHAVLPDGSGDVVLYGPERRAFWYHLDHGPRTPADEQEAPLTHRVLRMTQPQPMPDGLHIVVATQGGLTLVGQTRAQEQIVTPQNKTRAFTTPFPLPDGRILCASTLKTPDRSRVDLGLYLLDPRSQTLILVYNDPATADYEARPIQARSPPPRLAARSRQGTYSGRFLCASVRSSQEKEVAARGRLVRLIEGVPVVARHSTQTNPHEVWKNHGGTFARVLGTAPLASDGSFYIEAPADRLLHFQVLDSDRRVVGNQLTWINVRPGETKSCIGCHETPDTTSPNAAPIATRFPPLQFLPRGDALTYRAKAWFKGSLPAQIEERTRTVRAVNLLAR